MKAWRSSPFCFVPWREVRLSWWTRSRGSRQQQSRGQRGSSQSWSWKLLSWRGREVRWCSFVTLRTTSIFCRSGVYHHWCEKNIDILMICHGFAHHIKCHRDTRVTREHYEDNESYFIYISISCHGFSSLTWLIVSEVSGPEFSSICQSLL